MKKITLLLIIGLITFNLFDTKAQTFNFPAVSSESCSESYSLQSKIEIVGIMVKDIYYDNRSAGTGSFGFEVLLKYSNTFTGIAPSSSPTFWKYQITLSSSNSKVNPFKCTNNISSVPLTNYSSDTFNLQNSNTFNGSASSLGLNEHTIYTDQEIINLFGFDSATLEVSLPCLTKTIESTKTILSADLFDFKLFVMENSDVMIEWSSNISEEFSTQIVERSFNGIDWKSIQSFDVLRENLNTRIEYKYIDSEAKNQKVKYYRIRVVSPNESKYSTVLKTVLNSVSQDAITIAPIPAYEYVHVLNARVGAQLYIYDLNGNLTLEHFIQPGSTQTIDISSLRSGMYVYKVITLNGDVYTNKLIKK